MAKGKWSIEAVAGRSKDGKPLFAPLDKDQLAKLPSYEKALQTAVKSKVSHPIFSGYYVKEAIYGSRKRSKTGNIEYGRKRALHGEETSIAAFYSLEEELTPEERQ